MNASKGLSFRLFLTTSVPYPFLHIPSKAVAARAIPLLTSFEVLGIW